ENGEEAVRKISADIDLFSLILMDVQMPVLDGLNATRQIRSMDNPKAGTIPIIAMTANAFKEDIDICIKAGMNEHVAKPIDMNEFFKVLEKYLN
ncbi:MAG: response regulator, partial [Treponema sp.]|nr:response regulator [Treponema sp.]